MEKQQDKRAFILEMSAEINRLSSERDRLAKRIDELIEKIAEVAIQNSAKVKASDLEPQFDPDQDEKAQIGSTPSQAVQQTSLRNKILMLVEREDRAWTSEEIASFLGVRNLQTVQSTVSRMAKAGLLSKPDKRHVTKRE